MTIPTTNRVRPSIWLAVLPPLALAVLAGWMTWWNAQQRTLLADWDRAREARQLVDSLLRTAGVRPRELLTDPTLLDDLLALHPQVGALGLRSRHGWVHTPVGSQAARLVGALPPAEASPLDGGLLWCRVPLRIGPPEGSPGAGHGRGPWWARARVGDGHGSRPPRSGHEPEAARSPAGGPWPTQPVTGPAGEDRRSPGGGPFELAIVFTPDDEAPGWGFTLQMIVWPAVWLLVSGLWLWSLRAHGQMAALEEARRREAHLAAVGQMAARLAHEIKNPLGAIRAAVQHLLSQADPDPAGRPLLQVVEGETHRLEELTHGILDFSRPVQVRPERLPLGPFLTDALEQFATLHRRPAIPLSLPATLPDLPFDAGAVRQILDNLLANAWDACPDGPVTCTVRLDPAAVVILVEDRGPGLDESVQERVFEPFFSTKARGYGLGLAISRRLAEAHGGRLNLRSRPDGGGVAELTLPLEVPDARPA
ncbi:MAG: HAMP domain-containing histidine kinase [Candidatus Riflebacteria bacterium]|nr:HAMP domain-containing histidine kinase [Candidatus Riflebacteria bacterium]